MPWSLDASASERILHLTCMTTVLTFAVNPPFIRMKRIKVRDLATPDQITLIHACALADGYLSPVVFYKTPVHLPCFWAVILIDITVD